LLLGQGGVRQDIGHADDGIHRGTDLVAHAGQEIAFRSVGRLGFLHGALQFRQRLLQPFLHQLFLFQTFQVGIEPGDELADFVPGLYLQARLEVDRPFPELPKEVGQLLDRTNKGAGDNQGRQDGEQQADHQNYQ